MSEEAAVAIALALLPIAAAELRRWDRRRMRRAGELRTRATDVAVQQLQDALEDDGNGNGSSARPTAL